MFFHSKFVKTTPKVKVVESLEFKLPGTHHQVSLLAQWADNSKHIKPMFAGDRLK